MNLFKKICRVNLSIIILFAAVFLFQSNIYAAGLSLGVNASSITVGKTVTATVSVPSGYGATVAISFDSSVLNYSSCSVTASDNGGTVVLNIGDAMGYDNSAVVTFKAVSSGNCTISATSTAAGDSEGEFVELSGASAAVTVENKITNSEPEKNNNNSNGQNEDSNNNDSDEDNSDNSGDGGENVSEKKSSDASLKSIVLSQGKLSPAFESSTASYTASVDNKVSSISITAVPTNDKAKVVSVTGNDKLEVGANTVTIKVKAESGITSTYTIIVTRAEKIQDDKPEEPLEVSFDVNGNTLYCINEIPQDLIPNDFEKNEITIDNCTCNCLSFNNGNLQLLYLGNEKGENAALYVYNAKDNLVYPFVKLSCQESYIILLLPDVSGLPEGYEETTFSFEGRGVVPVYRKTDEELYLVYAINNSGTTRWYQYDDVEGTYQRYVGIVHNKYEENTEESEYIENTHSENEENNKEIEKLNNKLLSTYIFCGIVIVILLCICLALYILVRVNKRNGKARDNKNEDSDVEFIDID